MTLRLACALAALLTLTACEARSVAEADNSVDAAPAGSMSAEAAPAAAPAAPSRPAFATPYPGATIAQNATAQSSASAADGAITFTTDASPEAVVEYYRSKAEGAGLAPVMGMSQGETRAYGAQGGGASVSVVASPEAEKTSVQLTWSGASPSPSR